MKKSLFWILMLSLLVIVGGCNFLNPVGSISGKVTDGDTDAALQGVKVTVDGKSSTTDANGNYLIDKVANGTKTLTAEKDGYVDYTVEVVVEGKVTHDFEMTLLPPAAGALQGTVKDAATTEPVQGVTVSVAGKTATTGVDGKYTVADIEVGTYTVTASKAGYVSQTAQVAITENATATANFDLVEELPSVQGVVTDSATQSPLEGVTIDVAGQTVTTGADGKYTVADIEVGTYTVTASKAGYVSQTAQVAITENATATANFDLVEKLPSVQGVVTDSATQNPLEGVTIDVAGQTVTTGADGKYAVADIEAGTYTVTASKARYVSQTAQVVITENATATANFDLVGELASVQGVVTDSTTESPLQGVTVNVAGQTVTTGADGTYAIGGIVAGTYTVSATLEGYISMQSSVILNYGDDAEVNFSLTAGFEGTATGYVTQGRGGPAVEGAIVSAGTVSATTDASGYFALIIEADKSTELMVEKVGFAKTRVQAVEVAKDETKLFEIPLRPMFSPDWNAVPPVISIEGVTAGQELTGEVTFTVKVTSDMLCYVGYVYLGGEQRYPNDGFVLDTNELVATIDTTLTPNGASYIRVLAYDYNENAAMYTIPVTINNAATDLAVPGDIAAVGLLSQTTGTNIGYYVDQRREYFAQHGIAKDPAIIEVFGETIDLNSAPAGASLFNRLTWEIAQGADGYTVYRSFDGTNFTQIGNVKITRFDDYSPLLAADKETTYKIVPYNSFGEGNGFIRTITPLPAIQAVLKTPANGATNVELNPAFTWELEASSPLPAGTMFYSELSVFDVTDYQIWFEEIDMAAATGSIELPFALAPGGVYSWDIIYGEAAAIYANDETGYSIAFSTAGEGEGSENGEFIFTTTTTIE